MNQIFSYFPNLTEIQKQRFEQLPILYQEWNQKINVISRKDVDEIVVRHILHSLAIAKFIQFAPGTTILDVGTGGGFPGIPLAIMFPDSEFLLIDSIGKKITVVNSIIDALKLTNAKGEQLRVETLPQKHNFVVSRAVTAFPRFVSLVKNNVADKHIGSVRNGIIYLKGGDFEEEVNLFAKVTIKNITDYFSEEFFETKKIIYMAK